VGSGGRYRNDLTLIDADRRSLRSSTRYSILRPNADVFGFVEFKVCGTDESVRPSIGTLAEVMTCRVGWVPVVLDCRIEAFVYQTELGWWHCWLDLGTNE
jgi:hypothetical protein